MNDFQDRLRQFIASQDLSVQKFERMCDLSNGAVNKMSEKARDTTLNAISKKFPQLNMTWLKVGVGNMLLDGTPINNIGIASVPAQSQPSVPSPTLEAKYDQIAEQCKQALEMANTLMASANAMMKNATAIMENAVTLNSDMKKSNDETKDLYDKLHEVQQEQITRSREYIDNSVANIKRLREDIRQMIDNQTRETEATAKSNVEFITSQCKTIDVNDIRGDLKTLLSYHQKGKVVEN